MIFKGRSGDRSFCFLPLSIHATCHLIFTYKGEDEEHLVVASRSLENATYLPFEEKDVTYCR